MASLVQSDLVSAGGGRAARLSLATALLLRDNGEKERSR
jgi:nicotinate-nucleotide pyrophosphorylase